MGIRFSCHGCSKPLNIKNELAGRRGVCPDCNTKFRIPGSDAEFSIPLETSVGEREPMASGDVQHGRQSALPQMPTASTQPSAAPQASAAALPEPGPASNNTGNPSKAREQHPAGVLGLESELLGEGTTSTWYVRPPSGGQYGPATTDVLMTWISEGRVAKSALIWRDGWPQWREACDALPELAETLPGAFSSESATAFKEPSSTSKVTTSIAREKTSPVRSDLSGNSKIGATRRKRSTQRIALVAILATLVVGLVITLLLVATTGE